MRRKNILLELLTELTYNCFFGSQGYRAVQPTIETNPQPSAAVRRGKKRWLLPLALIVALPTAVTVGVYRVMERFFYQPVSARQPTGSADRLRIDIPGVVINDGFFYNQAGDGKSAFLPAFWSFPESANAECHVRFGRIEPVAGKPSLHRGVDGKHYITFNARFAEVNGTDPRIDNLGGFYNQIVNATVYRPDIPGVEQPTPSQTPMTEAQAAKTLASIQGDWKVDITRPPTLYRPHPNGNFYLELPVTPNQLAGNDFAAMGDDQKIFSIASSWGTFLRGAAGNHASLRAQNASYASSLGGTDVVLAAGYTPQTITNMQVPAINVLMDYRSVAWSALSGMLAFGIGSVVLVALGDKSLADKSLADRSRADRSRQA
jgi:hypothetical protein